MRLSLQTGKETHTRGSCQMFVFGLYKSGLVTKEAHVGLLNERVPGTVERISHNTIPAFRGRVEEMGRWTTAVYEVNENLVFKVFGQSTGGRHALTVNAAVYFQVRSHAAMQRIRMATTGLPGASLTAVDVVGRFDILTPQQVTEAGFALSPYALRMADEVMVRRAFEFTQLEPEIEPRPVVIFAERVIDGEVQQVRVRDRRRALNLD